jgi:hypothetical protein
MRFVSPETVRINLSDGQWIDVKKTLTAGEEKAYRSAGFKRVSQRQDDNANEVDIDWQAMAFARVDTYLVEWSAKKPDGKDMPLNKSTIRNLDTDSFKEIDDAILAHIDAVEEAKKTMSPGPTS